MSMLPLVRNLPKEVEVCLFELPGRGMSRKRSFVSDYREGKRFFLQRIQSCLDRPSVILGHSLGGILAYSLAASLSSEKQRLIKKLILSGARSPASVIQHAVHPERPFAIRTVESIKRDIKKLRGLPQEVMEDRDLLQATVDATGRDFHLIDTFPADEQKVISIPLELWLGREDTVVQPEDIKGWEKLSAYSFACRIFTGDHFYLFENEEAAHRLQSVLLEECAVC